MGELAALAAAACWAFASLMWARLGQTFDEVVLNFLKCALAAVALVGTLVVLEGRGWPADLSRADLLWLGLSGIAGLTIGDSAYFGALTRIGPRRTLLIWAMAPGISALAAWPILGEPINRTMILGMTVTLAGVVWVLKERVDDDGPEPDEADRRKFTLGVALGCVALLCQSSANVLQKLGGVDAGALGLSVVRLSVGAAGLGIWLGLSGRLMTAGAPIAAPKNLVTVLIATAVGTYLGIWLAAYGLLHADVGVASTLNATSPIFVLPLAALAGERISGRAIAGAFIAVAGIAVFFVL